MNPVSIIILLLIIAYCAFVIYKQVQKKKQGGCGGNCAGCSGCSSFQVKDSSVKKKGGNQQWEIQQVLCFMHLQSLLDYILSG